MADEPGACQFCGRYVLEVDGWAESLQPYQQMRKSWVHDGYFFHGAFHLACVREFPEREKFRREAATWIATEQDVVTFRRPDGEPYDVARRGFGYTDLVARLPSGEVYGNPRFRSQSWAYVENSGPFHFIDTKRAQALSRGERVRGSDGAGSTLLRNDPQVDISAWGLAELLDFLEIRDLYQGMLDVLEPEYRYVRAGRNRFGLVLEYSLSCIQEFPADLTEFFGNYFQ